MGRRSAGACGVLVLLVLVVLGPHQVCTALILDVLVCCSCSYMLFLVLHCVCFRPCVCLRPCMSCPVCRALCVLQALCSGSSKVACDYSNRLCQWNASYAFGAAVLGDLVSEFERGSQVPAAPTSSSRPACWLRQCRSLCTIVSHMVGASSLA
jgi:hypothetical protein